MKSAIYHSIKLPFDVEVAEKFLNGIYCVSGYLPMSGMSSADTGRRAA